MVQRIELQSQKKGLDSIPLSEESHHLRFNILKRN